MKQVSWSIPARRDLRDLYQFIAIDDPATALRIADAIEACGEWLGEVPLAGAALHSSAFGPLPFRIPATKFYTASRHKQ